LLLTTFKGCLVKSKATFFHLGYLGFIQLTII